jgi:hypothetical protein
MPDQTLARLVALWDVCDAAKAHVAFMHAYLEGPPTGRAAAKARAAATFKTLRTALGEVLNLRAPVRDRQPPMAAHYIASLEVAAILETTTEAARMYAIHQHRYVETGTRRADRNQSLIALCKELDIVTFYRNGPVVKDELDDPTFSPTEATP